MKKTLIPSVIIAGAIVITGSLSLASSTTTQSHGVSVNQVSLSQSDWGSVAGHGYTALVQCPLGQDYMNGLVLSEDNSGAYNFPDFTGNSGTPSAEHKDSNGYVDGVYLTSSVSQGSQGDGVVELICAG